jgi:starch synthase
LLNIRNQAHSKLQKGLLKTAKLFENLTIPIIFLNFVDIFEKAKKRMSKPRVLFISQEMTPYLPETELSNIARVLPQGIQERGKEIRAFMPRYGCINERRHQLHEVIRLSGMNLVVNDFDHPLIIKVASIQPARMQVYFIDNDEYFQRKAVFQDTNGNIFEDNDERSIFFVRGVLETVKKLGWSPDIIHCQGWMTAMLPVYLKSFYKEDPIFTDTQVVYSLYNTSQPSQNFGSDFSQKLAFDGVGKDIVDMMVKPSYEMLHKLAIREADAVIQGNEDINASLLNYAKELDKPFLAYQGENFLEAYDAFYDKMLLEKTVYAE